MGKTNPRPHPQNDANPNHFGTRPRGEGEGDSGEAVNKRRSQAGNLDTEQERGGGIGGVGGDGGGGMGGKTARRCMVSMWEQSTYLN